MLDIVFYFYHRQSFRVLFDVDKFDDGVAFVRHFALLSRRSRQRERLSASMLFWRFMGFIWGK